LRTHTEGFSGSELSNVSTVSVKSWSSVMVPTRNTLKSGVLFGLGGGGSRCSTLNEPRFACIEALSEPSIVLQIRRIS
jgi:hypothetical protein